MKRKHRSYHRPSLLLYDDNAPYSTPSPSSPPAPSSGRFPSLPPVSSSATPTTSRYTLRQPPPPPPPPPPFMRPDPPLNSTNALAILILLSFLFFMSLFSVYIRHYVAMNGSTSTGMDVSRGRRHHAPDSSLAPGHWPRSATVNCVDPTIIRSLPSYAYDGCTNYQICCPVCLSEFEEGETVKVIPLCDHVFHPQCIDRWLQCHLSCPLCRATQLLEVGSRAAEPKVCGRRRRSTSADCQGTSTSPVRRGDTFVHSEESEAAPRAAVRCHSFSHSGRELSGDGRASLYKTLSF